MDDKDLMNLVMEEMQMIVSVHDAIYYTTKEIIDAQLCTEFRESSIVLIKIISQNHDSITNEELALVEGIELNATNVWHLFKMWLVVVNNDLFDVIFSLIRNKYTFNEEEMKHIIDYILLIRYNDVIKFQKFFGFLTSFGHLLPMETFGIGMYILEIYGFIKKDIKQHPNYKYNPKNDIQHEFRECTICGCTKTTPKITVYSFKAKDFTNPHMPFKLYLQCDDCGNCFTKYTTSQRFKRVIQNKIVTPTTEIVVKVQSFDIRKSSYFSEILNKVQKLNSNKELLNVGIGSGEILATALDYGYNADAVELSEEKAQKTSDVLQIQINNCEFIEFETTKRYSTIIIEDFLEYEFNLGDTFKKIYQLIEDDGVVWISTPNFNSSFSRLTREYCELWINPLNITLFCREGLEKILHEHGFKVVEYNIARNRNGYMEMFIQKDV